MATNRPKLRQLVLAALMIACGCQGQVTSDAGGSTGGGVEKKTEAYSVAPWAAGTWNFYMTVRDRPLRICTQLDPGVTIPEDTLQLAIQLAVLDWVNAVQPNSRADLFWQVEFTCNVINNDNIPLYDFAVVMHTGYDRAWNHGDIIDLYQDEPLFYETVLHEIGHSFGMGDTYDEANGGCLPFQPNSVMCDCNFTSLQPDDVSGARQSFRIANPDLYIGPSPISAQDSGLCLDAIAYGTGNGTGIQLWECPLPTFNQVWRYDSNTKAFVGDQSGRCLDVAWADTANGTPVWLWDCHGGPNQQWEFWADGTIRSVASGKCLEVAGFGTTNGSAIQIWDCHGGSNQRWWYF